MAAALAAGCHPTGPAGSEPGETSTAEPRRRFVLGAPQPGLPDRENTLAISGASPLFEVVLYRGLEAGLTAIEGCPGLAVGIAGAAVMGSAVADGDGTGALQVEVEAQANGDRYLLQAVQPGTCAASNLVEQVWAVDEVVGSWNVEIADAIVRGLSSEDLFGTRVDLGGDGDGDGRADLIVGAVWYERAGSRAGAAYVFYSGPYGIVDASAPHAVLVGEEPFDWAGIDSSWAGDVNGDGADDILVGARKSDSSGDNAGRSYLLLGPVTGQRSLSEARTVLLGEGAGDESGRELEGAGDVDGDGLADFLVGAEYADAAGPDSGAAYLLYGPPPTGVISLAQADARFTGEVDGDQAGGRVAPLGDVDGDGLDDFAIGAIGADTNGVDDGALYVVRGPVHGTMDLGSAEAMIHGAAPGDRLGSAVVGPGDIDGDAEPDLVVGAMGEPGGETEAGAAYVVRGPLSGTIDARDAFMRVVGNGAGDLLGGMLDACDLTGDGEIDLLLAAKFEGFGGLVYLFRGPLGGDRRAGDGDARFVADEFDARVGQDVGCGGDANGDGVVDFVIGAELADGPGGNASGAAYVFSGR